MDAEQRKEPTETCLGHAREAEAHYLEALKLCPNDAITDLAPMHNVLGNLFTARSIRQRPPALRTRRKV
jgi:hypothetical protein